jgi:L-lactate dehydrogenase (cytochrome)
MKPSEVRALISLERPEWRPTERRLRRAHCIADMRDLARRRTPRAVFDYVEGGADEELSLLRNVQSFRQWDLVPVGPSDVSSVELSTSLLGRRIELPLICAPTGYTRMMHPEGERAVAGVAARAGVPYTLSTMASTSLEDIASTGHPDAWFQLYVCRDRGLTRDVVSRAWTAGYRVLEVTVDTPVSGYRIRDVRNGLTIPPRLTARTLLGIAGKPVYWSGLLRHPAITFANFPPEHGPGGGITIGNIADQFEPRLTWDDIGALREQWGGPLLVKGPLGPEGARTALAVGADGVHLSNHGGRQLDRVVPPLDLLADVREAVGEDCTIVLDSGIRHGTDLAVAIALGADAGAIGRAYLYGLMVAGEAGVAHALALLTAEFKRTMQLLGVTSIPELRAAGPRLLRRRLPDRAAEHATEHAPFAQRAHLRAAGAGDAAAELHPGRHPEPA